MQLSLFFVINNKNKRLSARRLGGIVGAWIEIEEERMWAAHKLNCVIEWDGWRNGCAAVSVLCVVRGSARGHTHIKYTYLSNVK